MSTYVISDKRLALRLEPIVDLKKNEIVGYEALSRFVVGEAVQAGHDYESYFSSLSPCALICVINRQLEIFQKWHSQHPEVYSDKVLFINVRPDLLEDEFFVSMFFPFVRRFRIAIEINASESKCNHAKIDELTSMGISVWIDDYTGGSSIGYQYWDGIKIDKFAFWSAFHKNINILDELKVDKYLHHHRDTQHTRPTLLVEGIESEAHLYHAIASGFELGQGYYWASLS